MAGQSFEVEPIAQVIGGRIELTDDYWGGIRSIIRIDSSRFDADATAGLDAFSHLEIVFRFHLTDPADLNLGARRPRDNPDWPEVGIFGHRNMRRLNWLGLTLPSDQGRWPRLACRGARRRRRHTRTRHQALVPRVRPAWHRSAGRMVERDAHRVFRHTATRLMNHRNLRIRPAPTCQGRRYTVERWSMSRT